jgi:hypothetical protein
MSITYNFLLQLLQVSPSLATSLAFSASVKCRELWVSSSEIQKILSLYF